MYFFYFLVKYIWFFFYFYKFDEKNELVLGVGILGLLISWPFKYMLGFVKELIMGRSITQENFM